MLDLRFSVAEIDDIISSMLSHLENKKFISNVKKFFEICDPKTYEEQEKKIRKIIIDEIVDGALNRDIQDKTIMLNSLSFSTHSKAIADLAVATLNTIYNIRVPEKEAERLDLKISKLLKFAVVSKDANKLISKFNDILSDTSDDIANDIDSVEALLSQMESKLIKYDESINNANNVVSLGDPAFINRIRKVIEHEKNPSSTVKTGIKMLNEVLGGGFKAGRVYCVMAPMKNWKSGLLLDSCFWAKKYNNLQAKDPTKKPVILYITLENSIDETIVRMMSYCEGNDYKIQEHSDVENMKILSAHGLASSPDLSVADIDLMYRPNKTITVKDIGIIMDEYEKQGKEVVFLAVDYIKRLRPETTTKDLRLDLGSIADDFHVLAVDRDIPIFTAMQLNRGAITEMDSAETFEAKLLAFNRIGASNAGESIDIPQNVDLCLTMVRSVDPKIAEDGSVEYQDVYVQIRVVAARYKVGDRDSFIHPFQEGNSMRLVEDIYSSQSASIVNKSTLIANKAKDIKSKGARHV